MTFTITYRCTVTGLVTGYGTGTIGEDGKVTIR